jgi:hypothetical protein
MPQNARSEFARNAKPWQASRLHQCTLTCRGATRRPDGPWNSALYIPKDEVGAAPEGNLRVDSGSCAVGEAAVDADDTVAGSCLRPARASDRDPPGQ